MHLPARVCLQKTGPDPAPRSDRQRGFVRRARRARPWIDSPTDRRRLLQPGHVEGVCSDPAPTDPLADRATDAGWRSDGRNLVRVFPRTGLPRTGLPLTALQLISFV